MANFGRFVASLGSDRSGVILPYVTLLLGVIVGLAVPAVNGGRYMSLQTQLQQGAGAFALTGSGELDHHADSIVRAAINNFLTAKPNSQNSTWFGSGSSQNMAVSNVRYLGSLPANDGDPITNVNVLCSWTDCTPDNSLNATYVEGTVQPVSLPTILPASLFGGVNTLRVLEWSVVDALFQPQSAPNPIDEQNLRVTTSSAKQVVTCPTNFAYLSLGLFGFLGLTAPSLAVSHSERAIVDAP
jgi:hypothetical protein